VQPPQEAAVLFVEVVLWKLAESSGKRQGKRVVGLVNELLLVLAEPGEDAIELGVGAVPPAVLESLPHEGAGLRDRLQTAVGAQRALDVAVVVDVLGVLGDRQQAELRQCAFEACVISYPYAAPSPRE